MDFARLLDGLRDVVWIGASREVYGNRVLTSVDANDGRRSREESCILGEV